MSRPPHVRERTPVPTEYEAGWAPQQVAMFWRKEKYLAPTGVRNLNCPSRCLVTQNREIRDSHSLRYSSILFQIKNSSSIFFFLNCISGHLTHYIEWFIMFSVITDIYNKKTKGPTLMELFTAIGKLKKFFLTPRDFRCVHHG
jgi:hypothetical protein